MTVKEFIEELKKLDQDKNMWLIYDPPYSVDVPEIRHLVGEDTDYAKMFYGEGIEEGDYAIIAY